jgi:hypothetical protein
MRTHSLCTLVATVGIVTSATPAFAQSGELIERTLAIVGGQVITLTDVRTAVALGLVDTGSDQSIDAAAGRLIDRLLVLREVQRYLPPEPEEGQIDAAVDRIRGRFSSAAQFTATLELGGFNDVRLRAWLRDDVRIAAYLGQRFAAVGVPTDEDVGAYYAAHRDQFSGQGQSVEAVSAVIRERLSAERRTQLIADWVQDLRRRTTIVELWKTAG